MIMSTQWTMYCWSACVALCFSVVMSVIVYQLSMPSSNQQRDVRLTKRAAEIAQSQSEVENEDVLAEDKKYSHSSNIRGDEEQAESISSIVAENFHNVLDLFNNMTTTHTTLKHNTHSFDNQLLLIKNHLHEIIEQIQFSNAQPTTPTQPHPSCSCENPSQLRNTSISTKHGDIKIDEHSHSADVLQNPSTLSRDHADIYTESATSISGDKNLLEDACANCAFVSCNSDRSRTKVAQEERRARRQERKSSSGIFGGLYYSWMDSWVSQRLLLHWNTASQACPWRWPLVTSRQAVNNSRINQHIIRHMNTADVHLVWCGDEVINSSVVDGQQQCCALIRTVTDYSNPTTASSSLQAMRVPCSESLPFVCRKIEHKTAL